MKMFGSETKSTRITIHCKKHQSPVDLQRNASMEVIASEMKKKKTYLPRQLIPIMVHCTLMLL